MYAPNTLLILIFLFFIAQTQLKADCIESSNGEISLESCNGDNTFCSYRINLCTTIPNVNPRPKWIEYSVEYDSDGDNVFDTTLNYTYNPAGTQALPPGEYCLIDNGEEFIINTPPNAEFRVEIEAFVGNGTSTSCSSYSQIFNASNSTMVLPVELSEFKGWINSGSVILQWKTLSEINSSHFIVERARGENEDFMPIGIISSNGESSEELSYAFIDDEPGIVNIYRLKMVDNDETYEYSAPLKVVSNQSKDFRLEVFPNPVYTKANINIIYPNRDTEVRLILMNTYGKIIRERTVELVEGENIFQLDTEGMPRGNYILTVMDMEEVRTQKIMFLEQ